MKAFSLIELLIAMALGVGISLVLGELYINHEQSFKFQQAQMQASHNGILASHLIKVLTENAGFAGCLSLINLPIKNHINHDNIMAVKLVNNTSNESTWSHQPLPDSSLLQLNYMSHETAIVIEDMQTKHYIAVSQALKIKSGDILMIADCTRADIFKVDEVYQKGNRQIIKTKDDLRQYYQGAMVGLWQSPILYIANTDRKNVYGQLLPALYWHTLSTRDEELVDGVSAFNVKEKKVNHSEKLLFNVTTLSDDIVSHMPSNNNPYPHHVMQYWQFNEYVS